MLAKFLSLVLQKNIPVHNISEYLQRLKNWPNRVLLNKVKADKKWKDNKNTRRNPMNGDCQHHVWFLYTLPEFSEVDWPGMTEEKEKCW